MTKLLLFENKSPQRAVVELLSIFLVCLSILVVILEMSSASNFGQELQLETVSSIEGRIKGLSGRNMLDENAGMLFVFDEPGDHGIWMKDMRFPIDILWLDDNYKVVHVERDVAPETYPDSFRPDKPAKYVLEVNAGYVSENGISKSDILEIN